MSNFAYGDIVVITADGIRRDAMGQIVNVFHQDNKVYAVEFQDRCLGFFGHGELKMVVSGKEITTVGHMQLDVEEVESLPIVKK